MLEKLKLPHIKTTPVAFGVRVEFAWPTPTHGNSEVELQCLFDDGRLEKRKIKFPGNITVIENLKAGECVQIRLRAIAEDGSTDEWDAHHWIKGVASSDVAEMTVNLAESPNFSIPACSLTALSSSTHYVEGIASVSSFDFEKETLSKILPEMLRNLSPKNSEKASLAVVDVILKAFEYLDKKRASQS